MDMPMHAHWPVICTLVRGQVKGRYMFVRGHFNMTTLQMCCIAGNLIDSTLYSDSKVD